MTDLINLLISVFIAFILIFFIMWTAIELGVALRLYRAGHRIEAQLAETQKVKGSLPRKHHYRYRYVVGSETYEYVQIIGRLDSVFSKNLDRIELLYLPRYPFVCRPYVFPFARILVVVLFLGMGLVCATLLTLGVKSPIVYYVWLFTIIGAMLFPKISKLTEVKP